MPNLLSADCKDCLKPAEVYEAPLTELMFADCMLSASLRKIGKDCVATILE